MCSSGRARTWSRSKEVQKHVNTIRRTEGKIRKCRELGLQRENQWKEFQQQLKTSFMEQRSAYLKDREQNKHDEAQLEEQKRQAAHHLKALIIGGQSQSSQVVENMDTEADHQAWKDFLADSQLEEDYGEDNDPWLQAALHAASKDDTSGLTTYRQQVSAWLERQEPGPTATAAPATPVRRVTQTLPMTPRGKPGATARVVPPRVGHPIGAPNAATVDATQTGLSHEAAGSTYVTVEHNAVRDPYQTSPSAPQFGTPPTRTTYGKAGDRVSVKTATMMGKPGDKKTLRSLSPQSQAHAQQLEAKRIALTQQLGPLHAPPGQMFLVDDDKDEGQGSARSSGISPQRDGGVEDLTLME